MTFLQTIRVRLLGAFGAVTLMTAIAALVGFIALNATLGSINNTSERLLPETNAAQAVATQVYKIAGQLTTIASSRNEAERNQAFNQYQEYSDELARQINLLADVTGEPQAVDGLHASIEELRTTATQLNDAQRIYLAASARHVALFEQANIYREQLLDALEGAIDAADEADVETYLRTGLSATAIGAKYAETAQANSTVNVQTLNETVDELADEIEINFAILGASTPADVIGTAEKFLSVRAGESGLFAARLEELRAIAAAESANNQANAIKTAVSKRVDAYSTNLKARVDQSTHQSQADGAQAKIVLTIMAVASIGASALIGWLYISRGLLKRMSALCDVMKAVSQGDLNAKLSQNGAQDELGEMEAALEVFRKNAKDMERLNEEKAEADKRAWEEKEAAQRATAERERKDRERARAEREANEAERKAMMRSLRKAFGVVIDAAERGDFSERVRDRFDDAELNELADGLNALAGTVQQGLAETRDVLAAVAKYDLSKRVEGQYEGEFEKLKEGVNATADNLTEIVGHLQGATNNLGDTTGELLNGANNLANRATQQAGTIEETSAATELLSRLVNENAGRASEARLRAVEANDMARDGGLIMEDATSAIDRIAASSTQISDIIGLIDNIAFQTNLLSLNASVEAARAGEVGSGFAVVAAEVRALSQSTSAASKEIKELIDKGAQDVKQGVELVSKVAESLSGIVDKVGGVTELMNAIEKDNHEQVSSLAEVNSSVGNMDRTIQQNASLAQEIRGAISSADERVSDIDQIAGRFTTDRKKSRASSADGQQIQSVA